MTVMAGEHGSGQVGTVEVDESLYLFHKHWGGGEERGGEEEGERERMFASE